MAIRNEARLDDRQKERAAGSYRWAFAVCKEVLRREAYRDMDPDIAAGAALYGLVLAARSYDEAKGHWPTHAARWIKGQIRDEARIWRRKGLTCHNGGHGGKAAAPEVVALNSEAARSL